MENKEELKKTEQEVKEFTEGELDDVSGGFLRKIEPRVARSEKELNKADAAAKSASIGEVSKN